VIGKKQIPPHSTSLRVRNDKQEEFADEGK
jgi:hypothetical protein